MVSDIVVAAAFTVSGPVVLLVVKWLLNRIDKRSEARALKTQAKLDEIHKEFNGMKDALVKSEKAVSKQEGRDEEKAEQEEKNKE